MTVPVGMGEVRASGDPAAILVAYGLGSCVAVSLYDPRTRVGGLAHVMLPSRLEASSSQPRGKFAECAVPMLLEELVRLGASPHRLIGKIAGGAQMLIAPGFSNSFNTGQRNVEAVKAALARCRVPLLGSDIGGSRGRTVALHVGSGRTVLRIAGDPEVEL